jgi:GNAT superfamily N-acetyltransferase
MWISARLRQSRLTAKAFDNKTERVNPNHGLALNRLAHHAVRLGHERIRPLALSVIGKGMDEIVVQRETRLDAAEFLDVLQRSGLGERRPVDDTNRIAAMAANADLVITARDDGGRLIGVSRCGTDFVYFCYCSDLAVDRAYQGKGIGRRLLDATKAALHPEATLLLISAPKAVSFYEHIGMTHHDRCFAILPPDMSASGKK